MKIAVHLDLRRSDSQNAKGNDYRDVSLAAFLGNHTGPPVVHRSRQTTTLQANETATAAALPSEQERELRPK